MATLREVREAIADTLASEFGASASVEDRPPDNITTPAIIVGGIEWQDQAMGGGRQSQVSVWVVVSRKHSAFIDELDRLCDPDESTSVPAAINADPTLGDVVDSCRVVRAGDYRDLQIASIDYYAATIELEVFH